MKLTVLDSSSVNALRPSKGSHHDVEHERPFGGVSVLAGDHQCALARCVIALFRQEETSTDEAAVSAGREESSDMGAGHNASCGDDKGPVLGNGFLNDGKLNQKGSIVLCPVPSSLNA